MKILILYSMNYGDNFRMAKTVVEEGKKTSFQEKQKDSEENG